MLKRVGILIGMSSVAVSPWTTFDPINPIKLALLTLCGCSCLIFLILKRKQMSFNRVLLVIFSVFFLQILISTLFSKAGLFQGLFGTGGRFIGAVSLLMFGVITIFLAHHFQQGFILSIFLVTALLSLIYSLLQKFGLDPAPWSNVYNSVIGFLGNPNFQSSLFGLLLIALLGKLFTHRKDYRISFTIVILIGVITFLILGSKSIQGIFVLLAGIIAYLLYYLLARKMYIGFGAISLSALVSILLFIPGVLGFGPLAQYIHKGTLAIRGDYWLAGLSMAKDNMLLGVGPDQYGTWYRFYRNTEAVSRINSEVVSNSAHNGYIDLAANLGLVALLAYLAIQVYVFVLVVRFISTHGTVNTEHAVFFALWVGFQAQMLISPNQLGLAIWGWVFAGVLISYDTYGKGTSEKLKEVRKAPEVNSKSKSEDFSMIGSWAIGAMLSAVIIGPFFYTQAEYRSALMSGDAIQLLKAANLKPHQEEVINQTISIFVTNRLNSMARELNIEMLREFPNSFEGWRSLSKNPEASASEIEQAKAQLIRLDPHNPDLR